MPPRTFPPELVDQVIDEIGDASRNRHRTKLAHYRAGTCAALRACAVVSKSWTPRSRARLFKEVKINVDEGKPNFTIPPPPSILPYIKELKISYACGFWPIEAPSLAAVLEVFATAPIERLGITGGILVDQRACIQECIHVHSTTLQTVQFQFCSISAYNIVDIVSGHHCLKSLRLDDCWSEKFPPQHPLITDTPDPNPCSEAVELELSLTEGEPWEGPAAIAAMVARLPYRFHRLDIDHVAPGRGTTEATNALIKANAGVLSSLRISIVAADPEVDIEPEHLFGLEGCSKLSELTLNVEYSGSCVVRDSISILSTLDPVRSSRLGKIVLETAYLGEWFSVDGLVHVKDGKKDEMKVVAAVDEKANWEGLDTVLSKLATASISMRGNRLMFILVVLEWDNNKELVSTARKWLPKLLPRFNELGLLHVHYGRGSHCRAIDDDSLCHDKPDCLV